MKCKRCGKDLIKVGKLTDKEVKDLFYINTSFETTNEALNPSKISEMNLNENQLLEYFNAIGTTIGKTHFLRYALFEQIRNRCGLKSQEDFLITEDHSICIHKE